VARHDTTRYDITPLVKQLNKSSQLAIHTQIHRPLCSSIVIELCCNTHRYYFFALLISFLYLMPSFISSRYSKNKKERKIINIFLGHATCRGETTNNSSTIVVIVVSSLFLKSLSRHATEAPNNRSTDRHKVRE